MWYIFGFLTLFTFLFYLLFKKEKNWEAKKHKFQNRYYLEGKELNKRGFFLGCENDINSKNNLSLNEKSNIDNFFKRVGLSSECKISDEKLNISFFLLSDDIRVCKLLKETKSLHSKFIELFEYLKNKHILVEAFYYKNNNLWIHIENDKAKHYIETILPTLFYINDYIDKNLHKYEHKNTDRFIFNASILLSISSVMVIIGIAFFYLSNIFVMEKVPLIKLSLLMGFIIVICLSITAVARLGKNSRTNLILLEFLTLGYVGASTSSYYLLKKINIELDSSKPTILHSKIIKKTHENSIKEGNRYYVSLFVNSENKIYEIPMSIYNKIDINDQVNVEIKKGLLGFRWIKDINKRF